MPKTIYGIKDPNMPLDFMFAIDPSSLCENREDYACLNRRIRLKKDLGWREKHLKHLLRQGNIWQDFPTKGYTMVGCEFQPGGEDQRVDILYIRSDGGLLPCELKIGGKSLDAHGQLIRYIADLHFPDEDVNLAWVQKYHQKFLRTISNSATMHIQDDIFEKFIADNGIEEQSVHILPKAGIIMDECFKSQLKKAIRYLNEYCGFSIRLIQVETFVADDWKKEMENYLFRIDFTDVQ